MTKNLFEEFKLYETMWDDNRQPLHEIKKYNPPAKIQVLNVEAKSDNLGPNNSERLFDVITYVTPEGLKKTAFKFENQPGYKTWFNYNNAAYSYSGTLLPDINPTAHVSAGIRNSIQNEINKLEETSHSKKVAKTSPEEYFKNITQSKEEAIKFIKEKLAPQTKIKPNGYFDISSSYAKVLAKETSGTHTEIGKNSNYNYKAFTNESSKFGLPASNILHYIKTGKLFISTPYEEI